MTDHTNPAIRIFSIVHETTLRSDIPGVEPALSAWAKIFKIEEPKAESMAYSVASRLTDVHDEILLLKQGLEENRRLRPQVYQATLNHLFRLFSPMQLSTAWGQVKGVVSLESMNLLETFQSSLPPLYEEQEISKEELSAIREIADNLLITSQSDGISEPVKAFIRRQAEMIHRAIDLYPIKGARSLREAHRVAAGDVVLNAEMVKENSHTPEIQQVASAWKKIVDASSVAKGVDSVVHLTGQAWGFISTHLSL